MNRTDLVDLGRYLITNNLGLKLLALAAGAATWLLIYEVTNHEETFVVETFDFEVDPSYAQLSRSVETLSLSIRGSEDDLYAIDASKIKFECDLRGKVTSETFSVPILAKYFSFPGDGVVVDIEPDTIELRFDELAERAYPVSPATTGTLPEGVELRGHTVTPDKVTVRGSKKILDGLESLSTEPLALDGHTEDYRSILNVRAPDVGAALTIDPPTVDVTTRLEFLASEVTLSNRLIHVLQAPDAPDMILDPATVTLSVKGNEATLSEDALKGIRIYVDAVGKDSDTTYKLPVQVNLPDRLSLIEVVPDDVTATLGMYEE